jgi:hypothetical protein
MKGDLEITGWVGGQGYTLMIRDCRTEDMETFASTELDLTFRRALHRLVAANQECIIDWKPQLERPLDVVPLDIPASVFRGEHGLARVVLVHSPRPGKTIVELSWTCYHAVRNPIMEPSKEVVNGQEGKEEGQDGGEG